MKNLMISTLVFVLSYNGLAADTHFFILSGQSNMARMKESEGFLPEAQKLLGDDKIEYIKVASPGKPIRLWLSEWNEMAQTAGIDLSKLTKNFKADGSTVYYPQIIAKAKEIMAKKPSSVTFVWMQGESDSKDGCEVVYQAARTKLIAKLRNDLKAPEMKIVIARISDYGHNNPKGKGWTGWPAIRIAQENIIAADSQAAMVNTDDVNGPKNGLHYPEEGYVLMGQRMARQAVALIKGQAPATDGMPK